MIVVSKRTDLKQSGLKTTQPRLKILDILESSSLRHMAAEDVYRRLLELNEEVGLATVYRVLTQFESAGLVIRHNFEGGRSVFELSAIRARKVEAGEKQVVSLERYATISAQRNKN